jgi:hypothetical protein
MNWLRVPYNFDIADLSTIFLAVCEGEPTEEDWEPAYRDMVNGQRYVQIRADRKPNQNVWLRDRSGVRQI